MALTKVKGHIIADDLALGGNPTTSTQSTGNNTTRLATTAFVQTELAALADSAPSTLNTLNELAAALGDDASFSTTVTNSIATKLPLAGGTLTGNLTLYSSAPVLAIKDGGTHGTNSTPYLEFRDGSSVQSSIGITNTAGDLSVWNTKNTTLRFATNNTQRMTINASGNVGIGTGIPDYLLEAYNGDISSLKLTSAAGGNAVHALRFRVRNSGNTSQYATLGTVSAETVSGWGGVLTFSTKPANSTPNEAVTERMRINASGKVGIGTQTPGSNHAKANNLVVGSGSAGGMAIFNGTAEGWYAFSRANANNTDAYDGGMSYNGDRDLKFHTNAGGTRMTIDGSGKVGIGTTSPLSKLHVYSSAATSAPKDQYAVGLFDDTEGRIQVRATNSGSDGAVVGLSTGSHNWGLMATAAGTFSNAFAIGYVDTSTDGNVFGVGSMSEKLIITTSGNVGIGTTAPSELLEVRKDGGNAIIKVQTGGGNDARLILDAPAASGAQSQIFFDASGTTAGSIMYTHNSGGTNFMTFGTGGSNTERMRINSAGAITSSTGGMTLQTQEKYGGSGTLTSTGSDVTVVTTTITVLEGSKVAVWFQSGQISNPGNASNPNFKIQWVNSGGTVTDISDHGSNHWYYDIGKSTDARVMMTGQGISGALSAGTYTIRVLGNVYNGTATFNYQNIQSHLILQEISG